jgi:hypothetical protein
VIEITTYTGLANIQAKLARMPAVASRVAARAADRFSELALETFDAGETISGEPWAKGSDGKPVTLRKSGRTRAQATKYKAVGTRILASVGSVPYARYQLKRGFLPRRLPSSWELELRRIADEEIARALGGAS